MSCVLLCRLVGGLCLVGESMHFVFAGWCWWDGMAQAVRADWVVNCVDWL